MPLLDPSEILYIDRSIDRSVDVELYVYVYI